MKTTSVYILGQHGAGKTTILNQLHTYFRSEFPYATEMTRNKLEITINEARFVISDVSLPMTLSSDYLYTVSNGDKFILVYAVDDNDSFEYIESIKDFLVSRKGDGVPITVLGNKNELSERALRYELVDCLVSIDWEMKYIEMSALTDDCVPSILKCLLPEKENVLLPPTKDDSNPLGCPPAAFRQLSNTDSDIREMKQKQTQKRRSSLENQGLLPRKDDKNQLLLFRRFCLPSFSLAVPLSISRLLGDKKPNTTLVDGNIGPDSTSYKNKEEVETISTQGSCDKDRASGNVSRKPKRSSFISKLFCLSGVETISTQGSCNKDRASGNVSRKPKRSSFISKLFCLSCNKET